MRRVQLFGIGFDPLTLEQTAQRAAELASGSLPTRHVAVNVDLAVLADRDPSLRGLIASADLVTCDGMPILAASRLLRRPLPERVAGVDLFERLVSIAGARGLRPYFLGARQEVVEAVAARARRENPGLDIAGARDGYWMHGEEDAVVSSVRAAGANILFVALPSPRKEIFVARHLEALGVPFAMSVGGSFDVYAGRVSRAPIWMQRAGLEWFHRFLQEPRKMFGRYFIRDARFLLMLARELARRGAGARESSV